MSDDPGVALDVGLQPVAIAINRKKPPIRNANPVGVTALRAVYRPIIKATDPTSIDNLLPFYPYR